MRIAVLGTGVGGPGELVVNATNGAGSIAALEAAGAEHLAGKVLIDIASPLDFSTGMPPSLLVSNTDSLAEQIQRRLPDTRAVKALNTVNALMMVDPKQLADGDHTVFVSGNDPAAKSEVTELLRSTATRHRAARRSRIFVIAKPPQ